MKTRTTTTDRTKIWSVVFLWSLGAEDHTLVEMVTKNIVSFWSPLSPGGTDTMSQIWKRKHLLPNFLSLVSICCLSEGHTLLQSLSLSLISCLSLKATPKPTMQNSHSSSLPVSLWSLSGLYSQWWDAGGAVGEAGGFSGSWRCWLRCWWRWWWRWWSSSPL